MDKKIVVLVSGSGTNLQVLIDNKLPICAVISSRDSVYSLQRAKNARIPAMVIKDNTLLNSKLIEINPDYIVLAGYLKILNKEIINTFKQRIINIHPSLLPSFGGKGMYGLNVHKAVLDYGCKVSGATVHFVDENIDTGKIISQKAIDILPGDTPEMLQQRIMQEVEWKILPKAVKDLLEDKYG